MIAILLFDFAEEAGLNQVRKSHKGRRTQQKSFNPRANLQYRMG